MKIIQLIYSLSSGGAERFVVDLSNELENQGHEVHLVVLRNGLKNSSNSHFYKSLINKSVHYHNLEIKEGFRLSAFTKVKKVIKQIKPNVIHCHLNVIPYIFPLALFNKKIKFYHTLHNVAQKTVGNKFQKSLNRYFYKENKIKPIAISEICNKSYKDFYQLNNAITIENGRSNVCESNNFHLIKKEVEKYKNKPETPVFIHIARFNKSKNQELLISVFNKLASENIVFVLLIIGNGFNTSAGKDLQNKACSSIKFLGEKHNVNDYLLCADVFCLTSFYEGLPISLLEALSAGCVPICTPVGGINDVITDGITGYLSDDISIESYYQAIKRFLNNPKTIEKKSLQDYFKNNYSIQKCAQKHSSLYNNEK